jgi:hypothetical protein
MHTNYAYTYDTYLEKVLSDAKLSKSQVHEVVLVGGSTRIPRIQQVCITLIDTIIMHIHTYTHTTPIHMIHRADALGVLQRQGAQQGRCHM